MSSNNSKFNTPPSKSTSANNNDAPPSTKALIHAKNVLQNLRRDLHKAKMREMQLFNSLKKVKANYNRSLAEKDRIQLAIDNQDFICSNLEDQYGDLTTTPGSACTAASPYFTFPRDNSSPLSKKRCMRNPYKKKPGTVDYNFPDASMDSEIARALEMKQSWSTVIQRSENHQWCHLSRIQICVHRPESM